MNKPKENTYLCSVCAGCPRVPIATFVSLVGNRRAVNTPKTQSTQEMDSAGELNGNFTILPEEHGNGRELGGTLGLAVNY